MAKIFCCPMLEGLVRPQKGFRWSPVRRQNKATGLKRTDRLTSLVRSHRAWIARSPHPAALRAQRSSSIDTASFRRMDEAAVAQAAGDVGSVTGATIHKLRSYLPAGFLLR